MPARSSSRARSAMSCARPSIPIRAGCLPPPFMARDAASGWKPFRGRRLRSIARRTIAPSRRAARWPRRAAARRCRRMCGFPLAAWRAASLRSIRRLWPRRNGRRLIRIVTSFLGSSRPAIVDSLLYEGMQKRTRVLPGGISMVLSNESILVILFVGLVAGWLAGKVVRGTGFGIIGDIIVGIAGALIASLLFPKIGIHLGTGLVSEIIYSAIGAVILLLIVRLVRSGGRF